ncbi:Predicted phosphohydrolase [Magnetospirillum sp. LM-5]|uniref:metallophosphoesterase n=1 Tax=Magnetospirillum sp. LM-5 TaxID=2681466 RepID=UPI001384C882|nr:metallophosphoesterase [Magnetospirillum sp. LM-5]CAA7619450.1 Predicted phosphohydrolase [Magnetospirillum sp. LM-5]
MSEGRDSHRQAWRRRRDELELRLQQESIQTHQGGERRLPVAAKDSVHRLFKAVVAGVGLRKRALANAQAIRVEELVLTFADLPDAFDGYTILHLSDLHVGSVPQGEARVADLIRSLRPDLAVITGDIQSMGRPAACAAIDVLAPVLAAITATDGIVAVLGNHDQADLVEPLERSGVRVLLNEGMAVRRDGQVIHLVGLDDIHAFFTPAAEHALAAYRDGFRIALVHTPEIAGLAAELGYRLYLCGHTHGGQICLPGGRLVFHALRSHTDLASGAWQLGDLQGYTSRGVGAGIAPVRFNCPPEATLIRLRRP